MEFKVNKTAITPLRLTSRLTTVHDGSANRSRNVGKRGETPTEPTTSAYNRGYPWGNARGRRMLREFVNIRRHPPPSATRPPAVRQTWYKRDRNVIASASKRLQTPTNAYKCLQTLSSV